jgi:hypothetical protein
MATETKTARETTCPNCGGENYGIGSGEPVQAGGWYGDKRFAWGRYAGVHMVKLVAKRCPDCKHIENVDPEWD